MSSARGSASPLEGQHVIKSSQVGYETNGRSHLTGRQECGAILSLRSERVTPRIGLRRVVARRRGHTGPIGGLGRSRPPLASIVMRLVRTALASPPHLLSSLAL